jgi:hypothetical protein
MNKPRGTGENLAAERKRFPRDGFQSADHRLAGLFVWRFRTRAAPAPPKAPPPQAAIISPAPGSRTPCRTFLEIQFDQPMTPPAEALPYLHSAPGGKDPLIISRIQYDAAKHTFCIPLLLPPKEKVSLKLTGFRSASGVPAEPIELEYQVSDEELAKADREKSEAGAKEPRLLKLLENMKHKRMQLTSLAERVQNLTLNQKDGLFIKLQSQSATFKWQKPDQFYGDATGLMLCSDFRIGSDGQRWWWHMEYADGTKFVVCPAKEMHEWNISICDPFDLIHETPAVAAAELGLNYVGVSKVGDADYLLVEAWQVERIPELTPFGSLIQWWINSQNYRPIQITQFYPGFVSRTRFIYDAVNEPLPMEDFAVPKLEGQSPASPEPLDAGYTSRYINLRDGSDGRMSLRWGKKGPGGTSSSGLN